MPERHHVFYYVVSAEWQFCVFSICYRLCSFTATLLLLFRNKIIILSITILDSQKLFLKETDFVTYCVTFLTRLQNKNKVPSLKTWRFKSWYKEHEFEAQWNEQKQIISNYLKVNLLLVSAFCQYSESLFRAEVTNPFAVRGHLTCYTWVSGPHNF